MPFMKPYVYETDYLDIDGPMGGEIIPCDVVDYQPTPEQGNDGRPLVSRFVIPDELKDYCENSLVWSIDRKHGWIGRYSADGYMDCTPWVAGDTQNDVVNQLANLYGDNENDPNE